MNVAEPASVSFGKVTVGKLPIQHSIRALRQRAIVYWDPAGFQVGPRVPSADSECEAKNQNVAPALSASESQACMCRDGLLLACGNDISSGLEPHPSTHSHAPFPGAAPNRTQRYAKSGTCVRKGASDPSSNLPAATLHGGEPEQRAQTAGQQHSHCAHPNFLRPAGCRHRSRT
jgi:hypothetical protein